MGPRSVLVTFLFFCGGYTSASSASLLGPGAYYWKNNLDSASQVPHRSPEASATPELEAMDVEISNLTPYKTTGLREARQRAPRLADDPSLKTMFLHANEFNPAAAAKQYAAYWNNRYALFRERAFFAESQDALDTQDRQALGYGHIRTIPENDQVLVMDLSRLPPKYDFDSVARVTMYLMLTAIQKSRRMQEKGVLFVVDVGNLRHFDPQWMKLAKYTGKHAFPAKTAGYCIANLPPTAATWARRLFLPFLGAEQRRVVQMVSNPSELRDCIGVDTLR